MFVVELSIDENLSFSNISGQIRDRMGDIVVRHCQDGNLGD